MILLGSSFAVVRRPIETDESNKTGVKRIVYLDGALKREHRAVIPREAHERCYNTSLVCRGPVPYLARMRS